MGKKKYIILLSSFAALFLICAGMFVYSLIAASQELDLRIDLKAYSITKMYTDNETVRVAGTQDGRVFAFDMDGETVYDIGQPYNSAVYDIAMNDGRVYVAFANGRVIAFDSDAAESGYTGGGAAEADAFLSECDVYYAGLSFGTGGNIRNTQLLIGGDNREFYLRGVFSDVSRVNRIYRFDTATGTGEQIEATSNPINGAALAEDGTLYYAMRSSVNSYSGEKKTVADLNEAVAAVSYNGGDGRLYAVTESAMIFRIAPDGSTSSKSLKVNINSSFVFSTGENFVAKITNGGVAMIDSEKMEVKVSMNAADSSNLVMWTDDSFVLRDESDINNPVITFYSASLARTIAVFSVLQYVFPSVAVVAAALAVLFGFMINPQKREAVKAGGKRFFRALYRHKKVYLLLVVPFALLILFYYIPIVLGFSLAFYDYVPGVKMVFTGFENLTAVVANPEFWRSSVTMLVFLVADLLKAIIPPILLAEAIACTKLKRFSLVTRILLFLPGIMPGVATTLLWSSGIFGATQNSLVNAFVGIFVPGFAKNWIYSASNATAIGTMIAFGFPWIGSYLIFFGAITGINTSIYEAARIEGCGFWRRFVTIDLPLILPQIKYIFVTSFIASVQNYTSIYILHGVDGQIKTPALLMYHEIINANYGVASVMGILIFLFLSAATVLNFRMQSDKSA